MRPTNKIPSLLFLARCLLFVSKLVDASRSATLSATGGVAISTEDRRTITERSNPYGLGNTITEDARTGHDSIGQTAWDVTVSTTALLVPVDSRRVLSEELLRREREALRSIGR